MDDALANATQWLNHERLFGWQAALFPTGYSGLASIRVGSYRDSIEPMRVVSGVVGRGPVHCEAPPAGHLAAEMERFLEWLESSAEPDALLKAGLAHLWFETIHPFEDGNGRLGRIIIDLKWARQETS